MMKSRLILGTLAGVLILLLAAEAAQAQVFVGRGRQGGTSVGVYTPGFSFQYGSPNYGYGMPYGSYYRGGYAYPGYGYGAYPSYYGSYPSYYYGSYPSYNYGSYPSYSYGTGTSSYYAGSGTPESYQAFYPSGQDTNQVELRITLPDPNARLWIENQPTQQQGFERTFVSPPLEAGHNYTYTLRATWMENGREVTREKTIRVQPGQQLATNFMDLPNQSTARSEQDDRQAQPQRVQGQQDDRQAQPQRVQGQQEPQLQPREKIHEGKVVRAGDGKLIMTDMQGRNQHTHDVATSARILIDGKESQLSDLREGLRVSVTAREDASKTVVRIEAKSENNNNNP